MNINDLAGGGKFLRAVELRDQDLTLTIRAVDVREIGRGDRKETKPILAFDETTQQLPLNVVNRRAIAKQYGDETDNWIGRRIVLYAAEVDFQGDTTLGIRVRAKQAGSPAATPTRTVTPPTAQTSRTMPTSKPVAANPTFATSADARKWAWSQFKQRFPAMNGIVAAETYKEKARSYFNGKPAEMISMKEWLEFVSDGFAKANLPPDPLGNQMEFKEDDIPF